MKKLILIVALATFAISCKKDGYEISGTAKGIENGKKVFLETIDETGVSIFIDTAIVSNEAFTMEGRLKQGVEFAYLKFENNASLPIILENGNIKIEFVKDSVLNSKISGTKNNDYFQSFNNENLPLIKEAMKFQDEYMTAVQNRDTTAVLGFKKKFMTFQKDMNNKSITFIKKNTDSYLSLLLLDNFIKTKFLSIEEAKDYFNKFSEEVKSTTIGQKIKKEVEQTPIQADLTIGKPAPNFSAPSPDGKTISLKESLGKVTIVDFWASWCGPCRAENPNVVAMYNELHSKGLNIIGVSLDKDAAKWKKAIAKDKLTWAHVSNLKFWDEPIAKQYNVQSIPATFILDAKGNIVAKDLRGDALKTKVKELLEVK